MDGATPRLATPGLPRPRTRGARRRIHTAADGSATASSGFPTLSLSSASQRPVPSGWIPPKYTHPQPQFNQLDAHDEEKSRLRAETLRGRLQATGLKRSIVQAQLFPEVAMGSSSNQHETRGSSSRPPFDPTTGRSSFNLDDDSNNNNNVDDNRPLVPMLLHPTGGALIPSRPMTTSSSLVHSTQGHRRPVMMENPPHSARERQSSSSHSKMADRESQKVPMTARDRYYIEKRVTTAPAQSPLLSQGNRRRPLKAPSAQPPSIRASVVSSHRPGDHKTPSQQDGDMARFYAKPVSLELPKRHELLSRTNEFKTLTETIGEHLSQQQQTTATHQHYRKDSVGSSHNVAQHLAPAGGAVPRDSFLYLRRVDSNPYNLALTNHAHINPDDYYTVSRLGVTHFAHNSSEFMPMEKFERENYIYSLIVKVCYCNV